MPCPFFHSTLRPLNARRQEINTNLITYENGRDPLRKNRRERMIKMRIVGEA